MEMAGVCRQEHTKKNVVLLPELSTSSDPTPALLSEFCDKALK